VEHGELDRLHGCWLRHFVLRPIGTVVGGLASNVKLIRRLPLPFSSSRLSSSSLSSLRWPLIRIQLRSLRAVARRQMARLLRVRRSPQVVGRQ
jgi:hypothetical protein